MFVRRFPYWRKERKLEEGRQKVSSLLLELDGDRSTEYSCEEVFGTWDETEGERRKEGGEFTRRTAGKGETRRDETRREKEKGWGKRRTKRSHLVSTFERCASHVGEDGTSGEEEKRGELEELP